MPRTVRRLSATGLYHVMLRGINRQRIFEDVEDYRMFFQAMREAQIKSECKLYAWCLMPNHVHMVIREGSEPIGMTFKRIGPSYVYWYNRKYERVGHLFQDRFRSEAVEDYAYLLTVIRYVHMNPVKAHLCRLPEDYPYSSYRHYFEEKSLIDSSLILDEVGKDEFLKYHREAADDECLDFDDSIPKQVSDLEISSILKQEFSCARISDFKKFDPDRRIEAFQRLADEGASIRQISRLTGASYYQIRKHIALPQPSDSTMHEPFIEYSDEFWQ